MPLKRIYLFCDVGFFHENKCSCILFFRRGEVMTIDTHMRSVREWCQQLEHLWQEQQDYLIEQVDSSTVEQFFHARERLQRALAHESMDVDDAAANIYNLWQGMNEQSQQRQSRQVGTHTLPSLSYPYNGLEPHIDEKTMRIHHSIHHKSYVDGLNKAEKELEKARQTDQFELIKHWERELAFHGAGHYLHTLFWEMMKPNGGGKPTGPLLREIERCFGSFEKMKQQFTMAADKVEGAGWALLVWSPRGHQLEILQAEKHQQLSQQDQIPLLAIDVWEHAYYLKHQNERKAYVDAWWHVVNWKAVQERYRIANQVKWKKS